MAAGTQGLCGQGGGVDLSQREKKKKKKKNGRKKEEITF